MSILIKVSILLATFRSDYFSYFLSKITLNISISKTKKEWDMDILIIEDNKIQQRILTTFINRLALHRSYINIFIKSNGQEALDFIIDIKKKNRSYFH